MNSKWKSKDLYKKSENNKTNMEEVALTGGPSCLSEEGISATGEPPGRWRQGTGPFRGRVIWKKSVLMKQILTSSVTVLRELSHIFKFVIILGTYWVKFWLLKFVFVYLMLPNRKNMYADVCLWLCTLVCSCTCVLLAKEKFIDYFILTQ